MRSLSEQIEEYLLSQGRWVKGDEICSAFGITNKRVLRAMDDRPGLCDDFAISHSKKGFRHIKFASEGELLHSYRAMRKHALGEIKKARRMLVAWKSFQEPAPEKFTADRTGQYVFGL